MPHAPDGVEILAWSALWVLVLRSISVCAFLFVSINWDILLRSAIQVHACGSSAPLPSPFHYSTSNDERNHINATDGQDTATERQRQLHGVAKSSDSARKPGPHSQPQNSFSNPAPPPPYSLNPAKTPPPKSSVDSIIRLYEDIMASDSQTIEVQQETLFSQQDIIRSQATVIRRMRQVLEEQDARIEALEEQLGGAASL